MDRVYSTPFPNPKKLPHNYADDPLIVQSMTSCEMGNQNKRNRIRVLSICTSKSNICTYILKFDPYEA